MNIVQICARLVDTSSLVMASTSGEDENTIYISQTISGHNFSRMRTHGSFGSSHSRRITNPYTCGNTQKKDRRASDIVSNNLESPDEIIDGSQILFYNIPGARSANDDAGRYLHHGIVDRNSDSNVIGCYPHRNVIDTRSSVSNETFRRSTEQFSLKMLSDSNYSTTPNTFSLSKPFRPSGNTLPLNDNDFTIDLDSCSESSNSRDNDICMEVDEIEPFNPLNTVVNDIPIENILGLNFERRYPIAGTTTYDEHIDRRSVENTVLKFGPSTPKCNPSTESDNANITVKMLVEAIGIYISENSNNFLFYNINLASGFLNNIWGDLINNDRGLLHVYKNIVFNFKNDHYKSRQCIFDVLSVSDLFHRNIIKETNLYLKFTRIEKLMNSLWTLEDSHVFDIKYLAKFCVTVVRHLVNITNVVGYDGIQNSEGAILHSASFYTSLLLSLKSTYTIPSLVKSLYNELINVPDRCKIRMLEEALNYFIHRASNDPEEPIKKFFRTLQHVMTVFKCSDVLKRVLKHSTNRLEKSNLHSDIIKRLSMRLMVQYEAFFDQNMHILLSAFISGLELFKTTLPSIKADLIIPLGIELNTVEAFIRYVMTTYIIPLIKSQNPTEYGAQYTLKHRMSDHYESKFTTKILQITRAEARIMKILETFLKNTQSSDDNDEVKSEKYRVYMRVKMLKDVIAGFDNVLAALQWRTGRGNDCCYIDVASFNDVLLNIFDYRLVTAFIDAIEHQIVTDKGTV